jgi:hypothetical protein
MADPELEAFKSQIDPRQYAASNGFELDPRDSWRGSGVMRRGTGEKIIIKRNANGHPENFHRTGQFRAPFDTFVSAAHRRRDGLN